MSNPMAIDIATDGPWLGYADAEIREAFDEQLRSDPFPERFHGLATGMRPLQERGFTILKKDVSIDPTRRDGEMVPCNLCGPRPKFRRRGILIVDERGWLFLIGPICGELHFLGRFRDEERRFDRERAEKLSEHYLLNQVANIAAWRDHAVALRPFAAAALAAHLELGRTGRLIGALRRAVTKQDGWLRVGASRRVLLSDGSGYRTDHYEADVGRIAGLPVAKSRDLRESLVV